MLVTKRNFDDVLLKLTAAAKADKALGFDTETTTVNWWDTPWFDPYPFKPRVFSMQFATKNEEFYFDFNHSDDKLGDAHFAKINAELTMNPDILWFIANAKFDLHHSRNHGVEFAGTIHCTQAIARVMYNNEPGLGLDDLGLKYLGINKLDVKTAIKERGLFTNIKKFGHNEKQIEVMHFDKLELGELVDYGKRDTRMCFDVGVFQINKIKEIDQTIFASNPDIPASCRLSNVMENEWKLTKVLFEMEREGVLIDRKYTEEAYEHEVTEYKKIEIELDAVGAPHAAGKVDWLSAKQLKPIFDAMGEPYSYTEKGNASFDKDALEASESQLAKLILQYRYHNKRAHTYFENFIWLADRNNVVHANAQPAGTQYGRMSYWDPNLQNVPKRSDKDEAKYKVRRCFIPKPGTFFGDADYTGAEYYLTMDYAREMPVIEMLKAGLDPHEKLRQDMNLKSRDEAKTMQFRILYGVGQEGLGKVLGYKGAEAKTVGRDKKNEYFGRMPKVSEFLNKVQNVARNRGYIFNWFGRVLNYDRNTSYKSPNGVIQSGVGDMTKVAQVKIFYDILPGKKSKMLLQVHDALLFKIYPDELDLIPLILDAMKNAYPHKVLPMGADIGFSAVSWSDLQDEIPTVT
jgi:DNA polymerase I